MRGKTMVRKRSLLRVLAVLFAFALVAAACGDDDETTGSDTTATDDGGTDDGGTDDGSDTDGDTDDGGTDDGSDTDGDTDGTMPDDMDPEGTLVLGGDLEATGSGIFDTAEQPVVLSAYHEWLFGTLLRMTPSGEVVPDLAESVTIIDPSTVTVVLKPDLVFTDDTPVDAEALKASWERTIATEVQGGIENEFRQVEGITIDGPLTVTAKLSSPIAGAWVRLLRLAEASPISPTAIAEGVDLNTNPVGAGPYTLESFEAGTKQVFVKNLKYWDAANIRVARIEVVQVTGDSLSNAIRSDTIDRAIVSAAQSRELQGVPDWELLTVPDEAISVIGMMCKGRPPFDDLKVRQALTHATDQNALNQALYDGLGAPMHAGFHPEGSPFFNPAVKDFYPYDVEKAKSLLAEAGYTDASPLEFEVLFTPGSDSQTAVEIIQQQWLDAGINITLKPITGSGDFFPDAAGAPMYYFPLNRTGPPKVTRVLVPGSFGNVCEWNDPELNQIMTDLQGLDETSAEGIALWQAASLNAAENALHAFGVFATRSYMHNTERLANVEYFGDRFGTPTPYLHSLYIKK
jgi:peptide/nickel transport system substrate-binding protein